MLISYSLIENVVSPRNCHYGRYSGAKQVMKVLIHPRPRFMSMFRTSLRRYLTLVCLAVSTQSHAQVPDDTPLDQLFTIRAIKVDETARSADRARRNALGQAELQAYQKLLQKITQQEDRDRLPDLSASERQALISGIDFVDEQSSNRRYIATVNVRFEPSLVSNFLAEYGVPHVLSTGRPVLVLHAHQNGLTQYLWDVDSALENARASVDWLNRIRGYKFARGSIKERLNVTASEVFDFNLPQAQVIAELNGLEATTIISSKMENHSSSGAVLTYQYYATDSGVEGNGELLVADGDNTSALVAMYDEILEIIDGAWRERLLVDTGSAGEIEVVVPSLSLESLAELEQRLSGVTLVQSVKTVAIGLPLSEYHISFTGRPDQLSMALRFEGLDLKPYGDKMILELRQ